MTKLSQEEKVYRLKLLSDSNFTNRTMLMLTGVEDILTQERYKDIRYYIDMTYDIATPELEKNRLKPSVALAAIAFNGSFRSEDYAKLVETCKGASAKDIKEFLTTEIDHEPKEKVIRYLSFPILTMMTTHLHPTEAADILLLDPSIIKNCIPCIRSTTLSELMPENTYIVLKDKAPQPLKEDLKIKDVLIGWGQSSSSFDKNGNLVIRRLDKRFIEALSHWADVHDARKLAPKTQSARKISQWLTQQHIRE